MTASVCRGGRQGTAMRVGRRRQGRAATECGDVDRGGQVELTGGRVDDAQRIRATDRAPWRSVRYAAAPTAGGAARTAIAARASQSAAARGRALPISLAASETRVQLALKAQQRAALLVEHVGAAAGDLQAVLEPEPARSTRRDPQRHRQEAGSGGRAAVRTHRELARGSVEATCHARSSVSSEAARLGRPWAMKAASRARRTAQVGGRSSLRASSPTRSARSADRRASAAERVELRRDLEVVVAGAARAGSQPHQARQRLERLERRVDAADVPLLARARSGPR